MEGKSRAERDRHKGEGVISSFSNKHFPGSYSLKNIILFLVSIASNIRSVLLIAIGVRKVENRIQKKTNITTYFAFYQTSQTLWFCKRFCNESISSVIFLLFLKSSRFCNR